MKKYQLSELVLDYDLYPRGSVDSHHVGEIAAAIEAGAGMPPLVIDKVSKRIVDGFHRWKAYRRLFGENHKVDCIEKPYKNDAEIGADAMRYNKAHGRALTQHDKSHCILLAEKLGIDDDVLIDSLGITMARLEELKKGRLAIFGKGRLALKQTIKHMAGRKLSQGQSDANDKLSGMNQLFYVNQIITLIENDLVDSENSDLLAGMAKLNGLLEQFLRKEAA